MSVFAIDPVSFALSSMTQAVRALYGIAGAVDEFLDRHIEALKASPDPTIASTGRVLEGAKAGFGIGYSACVIIIATGQLLLGNPLTAVGTVITSVTNPVVMTCAAVGAILYGWKALTDDERNAIIARLEEGFKVADELVRSVIAFVTQKGREALSSKHVATLKEYVSTQAAQFGRSLYAVTGKLSDLVFRRSASSKYLQDERKIGDGPLIPVLRAMDEKSELVQLLKGPLKAGKQVESLDRPHLESAVVNELSSAAAYSLPLANLPEYDDIVRMVGKQLKVPSGPQLSTEAVERAILFKVLEKALDKMSEEERGKLVAQVQSDLAAVGVDRRVTFEELLRFAKTAALDVGGTLGGLVFAAPGLAGMVGLNVLQLLVLKGILLTSGYVAAGGALLGFGAGGMLLAAAGAAGPIGLGLAALYTGYVASGPAYRKLIPAVCVIAAKRIELAGSDQIRPAPLLPAAPVS